MAQVMHTTMTPEDHVIAASVAARMGLIYNNAIRVDKYTQMIAGETEKDYRLHLFYGGRWIHCPEWIHSPDIT